MNERLSLADCMYLARLARVRALHVGVEFREILQSITERHRVTSLALLHPSEMDAYSAQIASWRPQIEGVGGRGSEVPAPVSAT